MKIYSLLVLLIPCFVVAQRQHLREISVNYGDSLVVCTVTGKRVYWTCSDKTYYWYKNDMIHSNIGQYSGILVHGKYEVFDKNKNLIFKTTLRKGVMTSSYLRWYTNGQIMEKGRYCKGKLSCKKLSFSPEGELLAQEKYRHGLLEGKSVYFYSDSIVTIVYKKGIVKKTNSKLINHNQIPTPDEKSENANTSVPD